MAVIQFFLLIFFFFNYARFIFENIVYQQASCGLGMRTYEKEKKTNEEQ